jgi:membrane carboxypeptidase/penicillin-binding protein
LPEAVVAIEDDRFYLHDGVDYVGAMRAGIANLSDDLSQGASTITMQVARNFYCRARRPTRASSTKSCWRTGSKTH